MRITPLIAPKTALKPRFSSSEPSAANPLQPKSACVECVQNGEAGFYFVFPTHPSEDLKAKISTKQEGLGSLLCAVDAGKRTVFVAVPMDTLGQFDPTRKPVVVQVAEANRRVALAENNKDTRLAEELLRHEVAQGRNTEFRLHPDDAAIRDACLRHLTYSDPA